jgi:peptidoglycan/xylan/chitin deacetylase (PgdA/CDA1 family)
MPILAKRQVPAHVFVITRQVGRDNRWPGQPANATPLRLMDWSQLEMLQASGFRIGAHTASHPDLRTRSDGEIEAEMEEADAAIEARLGKRPRYFAYPYGYHDSRVRAFAAQRYAGCFTTKLDYLGASTELDAIPRLDAHYLRSPDFVRALPGKRAHAYIALRRALRRLRGH